MDADNGLREKSHPNAIVILNQVINQALELRLPLRPRTKIVFGTISGGINHGRTAPRAKLGLEIRSDSEEMLKSLFNDLKDIVDGIDHEYNVGLSLKTISNVKAARLKFNHPLVKSAASIIKALEIKPVSQPTESELSIFLSHGIPALTLGISRGKHMLLEDAAMEIEPMLMFPSPCAFPPSMKRKRSPKRLLS